jgi:Arc/MetJ-type ribon-helix-helix transcriptional regulator
MTIHLSKELEQFVHDAIRAGRYATEDDVFNDALERLRKQTPLPTPGMGSIGAMHDDAELLDQVSQAIMLDRETRMLRLPPDE